MKIVEDSPGLYVATVDAPVTVADLAELAAQLPPDAICTDIELDHDGTLYGTWEVSQVVPVD
ncbi:hypothetical protein AB0J20_04980 [Micromonospora costi]|uniref:hypothetical protein n=1 Tax=Micromonospora costi TaxID=1530042 RepID=UPI0033E2FB2A